MGPKIFTVREANNLIPELEPAFQELDRIRQHLRKIKSKVDILEMLWGDDVHQDSSPDHREYLHYISEIEQAKQAYEAATRRFSDMECVLKSVENGLVDFYGVVEGRLAFLCWKRGESSVEYYHSLEDGFAGRHPVPLEKRAE